MEATGRRGTTKRPITHYWGMLKDLDDSQKLQLVTMLVESVKPAKSEAKKRKPNIDDYFGIWSDEEYMDADELVKEIYDARCYNPKRDEFLEKFFTEP